MRYLKREIGHISDIILDHSESFMFSVNGQKFFAQKSKQVFVQNDLVSVIYHVETRQVLAILNQTSHVLYLDGPLQKANKFSLKHAVLDGLKYSVSIFVFLMLMNIFVQYFWDGTFYYADLLWDTGILLTLILSIQMICMMIHAWKSHYSQAKQVYSLLDLPVLDRRMLHLFEMRTSYFYHHPSLYDVSEIISLQQSHSQAQIEQELEARVASCNEFGIYPSELPLFALKRGEGDLHNVQLKQDQAQAIYDDPMRDFTAQYHALNLYGYFDDFNFQYHRNLLLIYSNTADEQGHYVWLISDKVRYLSLDEDLLNSSRTPVQYIYQLFGDIHNLTEDKGSFLIFTGMMIVVFLGLEFLLVWGAAFAVLYFAVRLSSFIFNKLNRKRNINAYVRKQVAEYYTEHSLKQIAHWDESKRIFNAHRNTLSRTGYKIF